MAESVTKQYGSGEAGQPVGMRLNQYPTVPGGLPGPVGADQSTKGTWRPGPAQQKAAAGANEEHIEPGIRKTDAAVKGYSPRRAGRGEHLRGTEEDAPRPGVIRLKA